MRYSFLLMLCLLPVLGFSQGKKNKKHWEIGLNSTQLLRNLFAQNPTGLIGDYSFFIKRGSEKLLFRSHFGGSVRNKNDSFNSFGQSLSSKTMDIRLGFGLEKRQYVYKKLQLVWGGDLLPSYYLDRSSTFLFNQPTSSHRRILENTTDIVTIGAGPFIGLRYAINKHFALSTESSLYLFFSESRNSTTEDGTILQDKSSASFSVSHTLPNSLFVVFSF